MGVRERESCWVVLFCEFFCGVGLVLFVWFDLSYFLICSGGGFLFWGCYGVMEEKGCLFRVLFGRGFVCRREVCGFFCCFRSCDCVGVMSLLVIRLVLMWLSCVF